MTPKGVINNSASQIGICTYVFKGCVMYVKIFLNCIWIQFASKYTNTGPIYWDNIFFKTRRHVHDSLGDLIMANTATWFQLLGLYF